MDNVTTKPVNCDQISVIPMEAFAEFETLFALVDDVYPKFLNLRFESFMSFFCATLHTWCEDHHIDVREVIDMMRKLIHEEYTAEHAEDNRKEIF